jgi:hypothetical protein
VDHNSENPSAGWLHSLRRLRPLRSLAITVVIAPVLALGSDANGPTSILIGIAAFCGVELALMAEDLRRESRERAQLDERVIGLDGLSRTWQSEVDRMRIAADQLALTAVSESTRFGDRSILTPVVNALDVLGSRGPAGGIATALMRQDLAFLAGYANEALTRGRYPIDVDRNDYEDLLFSQYDGRPANRDFRATVTAGNLDWFSTESGVVFARHMADTLRSGKLAAIRRVFVYENDEDLARPESDLFLTLHSRTPYQIRTIPLEELVNIVRRSTRAKMVVTDFGIHGDSSVWETRTTTDGGFRGYFVFEPTSIKQYSQVFDRIWEVGDEFSCNGPSSVQDIPKDEDISTFRERLRILRS